MQFLISPQVKIGFQALVYPMIPIQVVGQKTRQFGQSVPLFLTIACDHAATLLFLLKAEGGLMHCIMGLIVFLPTKAEKQNMNFFRFQKLRAKRFFVCRRLKSNVFLFYFQSLSADTL